jgi:hypothetical protein
MPARAAFEYAVIRVVPSIERGEFINVGVVLFCRTRRFLDARIHLDAARLRALAPDADMELIAAMLDHIMVVCQGGAAAGPIGELPLQERFRWITAPRSTIVQPSPVHCGMCDDPQAELEKLFGVLVVGPQEPKTRN